MSSSELNTDDKMSPQHSKPTLCTNGCGFFGTAATNGLCSKCYRDFTKSSFTTMLPLPGLALSIKETPSSSQNFSWGESKKDGFGNSFPPVEFDQNLPLPPPSSLNVAKKNRCGKCNKKVGLTGFRCRCGNLFCGLHRYAEAHKCDFDFKAKGRSEIAKANPVVKADKLERL